MARELSKIGHSASLYTFFYDKEKCYPDLLNNMEVVSSGCADPKKLALLISKDTDILNPHDQEAYKVAYHFKKKIKNIPSVWMMNDVPSKDFGFWKEHQFNSELRRSFAKKIYHRLYDLQDRRFINTQEQITVLDNWNRDLTSRYFKKNATVVRSGLDVEQFGYKEHRPPANKKIKLLATGIFFPHRRFEDAISALKLLREEGCDATLTIVGDYNNDKKYHRALADLTSNLKLNDFVKFAGRVSEADLEKSYQSHDIFIFPNHLQTWGLVVFEAMAQGIPVIVSKSTGASEVLSHRENSVLVDPKTPRAIKDAVISLASDPVFYSRVAKNARRFVEENISWKKYAQKMLEVFNKARY